MKIIKRMKQLNQLRSASYSTFLCPSCWRFSSFTTCWSCRTFFFEF